jgi:hypothetical protein
MGEEAGIAEREEIREGLMSEMPTKKANKLKTANTAAATGVNKG